MLALRDDRSARFSGGTNGERTHQMRSYGMYVHGTCGQEILFAALRGREEHDDPDVPLRSSWLRREGLKLIELTAEGHGGVQLIGIPAD